MPRLGLACKPKHQTIELSINEISYYYNDADTQYTYSTSEILWFASVRTCPPCLTYPNTTMSKELQGTELAEFLAEDQLVEIIPRTEMPAIDLISVSISSFREHTAPSDPW
jgi:hypothetical protein